MSSDGVAILGFVVLFALMLLRVSWLRTMALISVITTLFMTLLMK